MVIGHTLWICLSWQLFSMNPDYVFAILWTNLESVLKSRDITLLTKVPTVKVMVFLEVLFGCESWTIKKAESQRTDVLNCGVEEDSWEFVGLQGDQTSQSKRKSILNIHWRDWCWTEAPIFRPPDAYSQFIRKDPVAGKDWRQEKKEMTEDEMIGCHHWHKFEQPPRDGEGQGRLVCCGPWGCKELDTTERLSNSNNAMDF